MTDVLKAIKELITVTEKVRDNTERIAKLEEKVETLHLDMVDIRGDIKLILNRLDMKEEISDLKSNWLSI